MAKKAAGLGRDFYSIFDDNVLEAKKAAAESIRLADVEPRRDQPRKTFDREALETLADSIAAYGVLQPIIVRRNPVSEETYEIIAGERRWRAAKMAGLTEIPAVVFDGDELKAAQVALIENIQREDLNPVEEALGYGALIERFGLTQDQVSKQVGKSRSAVTNALRLLDLPEEALDMLRDGAISAGHARALLGLATEDMMIEAAHRIVERSMSVREIEAYVQRVNNLKNASSDDDSDKTHPQIKAHIKELERRAMSTLGRRVRISRSSRKKVLEIAYNDDSDLEALLKTLCGENIFDEVID